MAGGLTVILGGGGVGKTTVSAALGLVLARRGRQTLVMTIDPARRLADTLGARIGSETSELGVEGVRFHASMPDSRRAVEDFTTWLFRGQPARAARVRSTALYRELSDALVGMHEMMCVARVDQEVASGRYDELVLDTAPGRHGLDFIDYASRLVAMLKARTVRYVAELGAQAEDYGSRLAQGRGLRGWGQRRAQALIASLVGSRAASELGSFFSDLGAVRERWLGLLRGLELRLRGPETRFWVLTRPGRAALEDAEHLLDQLDRRGLAVDRVLVNRGLVAVPEWLAGLPGERASLTGQLVLHYQKEHEALSLETRRVQERMARRFGGRVPVLVVPEARSVDPRTVLREVAESLALQLAG